MWNKTIKNGASFKSTQHCFLDQPSILSHNKVGYTHDLVLHTSFILITIGMTGKHTSIHESTPLKVISIKFKQTKR